MPEYITTHEELLKLHGAKVTCKIYDSVIDDAKICVEGDNVYVCQNVIDGCWAKDKLGYKCSWQISIDKNKYDGHNWNCTDVKVVKTADKVIEELDERLDDLTPAVIINANIHWDAFTKVWNELYHKPEKIKSVSTLEKFTRKVKELV